jgi:hypothetical protein
MSDLDTFDGDVAPILDRMEQAEINVTSLLLAPAEIRIVMGFIMWMAGLIAEQKEIEI